MRYLRNAIVVAFALGIAAPLSAQVAKRSPVEVFRDATQYQLMGCQLATTAAFRSAQAGQEKNPFSRIGICIINGKAQTEFLFRKAAAQVKDKPEALMLLNAYYESWLTTFYGIMPDSPHPGIDYQLRQGEGVRNTEEAWRRFLIKLSMEE